MTASLVRRSVPLFRAARKCKSITFPPSLVKPRTTTTSIYKGNEDHRQEVKPANVDLYLWFGVVDSHPLYFRFGSVELTLGRSAGAPAQVWITACSYFPQTVTLKPRRPGAGTATSVSPGSRTGLLVGLWNWPNFYQNDCSAIVAAEVSGICGDATRSLEANLLHRSLVLPGSRPDQPPRGRPKSKTSA